MPNLHVNVGGVVGALDDALRAAKGVGVQGEGPVHGDVGAVQDAEVRDAVDCNELHTGRIYGKVVHLSSRHEIHIRKNLEMPSVIKGCQKQACTVIR